MAALYPREKAFWGAILCFICYLLAGCGGETAEGLESEALIDQQLSQYNGFSVEGTRLMRHKKDGTSEPFIIRGINYNHTHFKWRDTERISESFHAMRARGANTIRVVLYASDLDYELEKILNICRRHGLVCMIELHDLTDVNLFEQRGDRPDLDWLSDQWTRPRVVEVLNREEYKPILLINIANECAEWVRPCPVGDQSCDDRFYERWAGFYIKAVNKMRAAGLGQPLFIDSIARAQDPYGILRYGKQIINCTHRDGSDVGCAARASISQSQGGVAFSVHTYVQWGTGYFRWPHEPLDQFSHPQTEPRAIYTPADLRRIIEAGLPLIIGEIGPQHEYHDQQGALKLMDIDERSLLDQAESLGVGYLAWSWTRNNGQLSYLNLVEGLAEDGVGQEQLATPWGEVFFGYLKAGADGPGQTTPPSAPLNPPPVAPQDPPSASPEPSPPTSVGNSPICRSAETDVDGDGWGWENGASCRINFCRDWNVDADGDGWGWENGVSCRINLCRDWNADVDGDGWGWENGASCRINFCRDWNADADGDGWGWENGVSCRINLCRHRSSDPDGDGWGWENNRSCKQPRF